MISQGKFNQIIFSRFPSPLDLSLTSCILPLHLSLLRSSIYVLSLPHSSHLSFCFLTPRSLFSPPLFPLLFFPTSHSPPLSFPSSSVSLMPASSSFPSHLLPFLLHASVFITFLESNLRALFSTISVHLFPPVSVLYCYSLLSKSWESKGRGDFSVHKKTLIVIPNYLHHYLGWYTKRQYINLLIS